MADLVLIIIFSVFVNITICEDTKTGNDQCDDTERGYLDKIHQRFKPPGSYTKLNFRSDVCSKPEKKFKWKKDQLENILSTNFELLKTNYEFKITDLALVLSMGSEISTTEFLKMDSRRDKGSSFPVVRHSMEFEEILTILFVGKEINSTKINLLIKLMRDYPCKKNIDEFLFIDIGKFLKQNDEIQKGKKSENFTPDEHNKLWDCGSRLIDTLHSIPGWSINLTDGPRYFLNKLAVLTGPGVTCEEIKNKIEEAVNANKTIDVKFLTELVRDVIEPIDLCKYNFTSYYTSTNSPPSLNSPPPAPPNASGNSSGGQHNSSVGQQNPSGDIEQRLPGGKGKQTSGEKQHTEPRIQPNSSVDRRDSSGEHQDSSDIKRDSYVDGQHSSEEPDKPFENQAKPSAEKPDSSEAPKPQSDQHKLTRVVVRSDEEALSLLEETMNFLKPKKIEVFRTFFNCYIKTNELCQEISTNRNQIFATFNEYNRSHGEEWKSTVCQNFIKKKFKHSKVIKFDETSHDLQLDPCNFDLSTKDKILHNIVKECGLEKIATEVKDFGTILWAFLK